MIFRARCALAAALVVTAWAPSAHAIVVTEDPLEGSSLNIGGTARSFNYVMHGGPLVGPLVPPDSNPTAISLLSLRPKLEWQTGESFRLVLQDQLNTTTSSNPLDSSGGPLALGQGRRAPLWLPLQEDVATTSRLTIQNRVDWVYGRFKTGDTTLTIGRQPVTFGRGVLFTPVDLLAPFSPIQIDTEFKPGVDAARMDVSLSESATFILVGVAGRTTGDKGFEMTADGSAVMPRMELSFGTTRFGGMAGYIRRDTVGGLDFFFDLGHGADIHGEGTVTAATVQERKAHGRPVFARAVAGSNFTFSQNLHGTLEAYYNGSGSLKPEDYIADFAGPRFATGETYNVGMYYGGLFLDWQIHTLLHLNGATLVNLTDPSALLAPTLRYSVAPNTLLIAGAFVPFGLNARTDPAAGLVTARSEFGLYPYLYHADLKLYF